MKTTAVIVARFQTPYLHAGHQFLLDNIRGKYNKVVIVLGIAPVRSSKRNPFDFYTRERMLKAYDHRFCILPLPDHASDESWSNELDKLLVNSFPGEKFLLYGSRDSFIPYYKGRLDVIELPSQGSHSASLLREELSDKVMESEDFRLGINYACQHAYSKVYPTVDVALFRNNGTELLLGKKPNVNAWRLPGGFSDPEDLSLEAAAKRELTEECGAFETSNFCYVGSARINDWRYKKEEDKIISSLFRTDLLYGQVNASDDLAELQWFPVNSIQQMTDKNEITPEHHQLIRMLLDYETIKVK